MNWCGSTENIIVGMKSRYQMIDVPSNSMRDLPSAPLRNGIPCVAGLPDKLLVTIESTFFFNITSKSLIFHEQKISELF